MGHHQLKFFLGLLCVLYAGKAYSQVYSNPHGPIYFGDFRENPGLNPPVPTAPLTVASLNVQFDGDLPAVLHLLKTHPVLKSADMIALQETQSPYKEFRNGPEYLARELGFNYAFAPAMVHPRSGKDYGNALLSKWSLSEVGKVVLPGQHFNQDFMRNALGASIDRGNGLSRIYSIHLETAYKRRGSRPRTEAAHAVILDARKRRAQNVVITGDFNNWPGADSLALNILFTLSEYGHATHGIGSTKRYLGPIGQTLDRAYVKGFRRLSAGKVHPFEGSDHSPIWVRLERF